MVFLADGAMGSFSKDGSHDSFLVMKGIIRHFANIAAQLAGKKIC